MTPQVQGANLANTYRALARTPWVAAVVDYKLQGTTREDFGVLNANGTRKPAFGVRSRRCSRPPPSGGPAR